MKNVIGGCTLARRLRALWPELPIVIATGHDPEPIQAAFVGDLRLGVMPTVSAAPA